MGKMIKEEVGNSINNGINNKMGKENNADIFRNNKNNGIDQ